MLATAVVVFREVLEAALVIGIVAAATRGTPLRGRWITAGGALGILGAIVVALFANEISMAAEGLGQEIFNASVLFAAVLLLSWHNIWMAKHGRELAQKANTLGQAVAEGAEPLYALATVVGVAILREGSEVVLFLYGMAASIGGTSQLILGGTLGLAGGAAIGIALYFGLVSIPMRYFFAATSWMILLLAAGMASMGARYLVQADVLPALGDALWDSSWLLSERGIIGEILKTLIGYTAQPMGIQLIFYLGTIGIVGGLMMLTSRQMAAAARAGTAVAMFGLAALMVPGKAMAGPPKVYSPNVQKGELELEWRGVIEDEDPPATSDKKEYVFEAGYGFTNRYFSSIFAEIVDEPGGGTKVEELAWENIIQLTEQGQYFVDLGVYLEYAVGLQGGEPDEFEGKILLEKTTGRFVHTGNIIFANQIGKTAEDGTELEYAWQSRYRFKPELEFGLQAFGKFGQIGNFPSLSDTEHLLGPAVFGRFRTGKTSFIYYEAGYLVGLTQGSPDNAFRWLLEYELYF